MSTPNGVGESMDWRFASRHWSRAGGNVQSLVFYAAMLERVRDLLPADKAYSWHDYGCAEGDGVAWLHAQLPLVRVRGFDVSPAAVANALDRWHGLEFEVGDVTAPAYRANVISSLHTLEHIADPIAALGGLVAKAELVIAVTPLVTADVEKSGGHDGMPSDAYVEAVRATFSVLKEECYNTQRVDAWRRIPINESNILLVLKGGLK